MAKRIILFLFVIASFVGMSYADMGDAFSTAGAQGNLFRIDMNGKIAACPGISGLTGDVTSSVGLFALKDHWENLPAKSTIAYCSVTVATGTLLSPTSTFQTNYHTQPAVPRNVVVSYDTVTGDSAPDWVRCSCTVTGKDARNNTISEVIVSTYGTTTAGKKAFISITSSVWSITLSQTTGSTLRCNMGSGDVFGLMGDLASNTSGYKVVESYSPQALNTYTFDSANDTWKPTNVPNGTYDYDIYYIPQGR
jgi:hypothetical protein